MSEKETSQNGAGVVRNSCVSSAPTLHVIKGRHKIGCDFCRFLFGLAGAVIVVWLITGPLFGFSDTWQLIINTGTTILMVFLIQNTQNRDSEAMHIKLDELIRAIDGAHNALLNLENLGERELDRIRADYIRLAEEAREKL